MRALAALAARVLPWQAALGVHLVAGIALTLCVRVLPVRGGDHRFWVAPQRVAAPPRAETGDVNAARFDEARREDGARNAPMPAHECHMVLVWERRCEACGQVEVGRTECTVCRRTEMFVEAGISPIHPCPVCGRRMPCRPSVEVRHCATCGGVTWVLWKCRKCNVSGHVNVAAGVLCRLGSRRDCPTCGRPWRSPDPQVELGDSRREPMNASPAPDK